MLCTMLTIIVWVLPLLVTPYAKMVPFMPSIDDWTTLSLVLSYTCMGKGNQQKASKLLATSCVGSQHKLHLVCWQTCWNAVGIEAVLTLLH